MRAPHPLRSSLALLALLALVCSMSACSGGDKADAGPAETTTTTVATNVQLQRGEVVVASAGNDIALDEGTQQAIIAAAQRYVDVAVFAPVVEGAVGEGYDTLFDSMVSTNATGADRAALTDEGIATVTGAPDITASPVRIDGLADASGTVQLLAASFTLAVTGETAGGPIAVNRNAELTYAPGSDGSWLITAYRVSVARETSAGTTATTAVVPS